jgi:hypothetical protein
VIAYALPADARVRPMEPQGVSTSYLQNAVDPAPSFEEEM